MHNRKIILINHTPIFQTHYLFYIYLRLHSTIEESPQVPMHNNCSSPRGKPPRYRSMFSNSMSPLTPSFGILPLDSNTPEPNVLPSNTTLTEANDQKSLAKRVSSLRAHVGVRI